MGDIVEARIDVLALRRVPRAYIQNYFVEIRLASVIVGSTAFQSGTACNDLNFSARARIDLSQPLRFVLQSRQAGARPFAPGYEYPSLLPPDTAFAAAHLDAAYFLTRPSGVYLTLPMAIRAPMGGLPLSSAVTAAPDPTAPWEVGAQSPVLSVRVTIIAGHVPQGGAMPRNCDGPFLGYYPGGPQPDPFDNVVADIDALPWDAAERADANPTQTGPHPAFAPSITPPPANTPPVQITPPSTAPAAAPNSPPPMTRSMASAMAPPPPTAVAASSSPTKAVMEDITDNDESSPTRNAAGASGAPPLEHATSTPQAYDHLPPLVHTLPGPVPPAPLSPVNTQSHLPSQGSQYAGAQAHPPPPFPYSPGDASPPRPIGSAGLSGGTLSSGSGSLSNTARGTVVMGAGTAPSVGGAVHPALAAVVAALQNGATRPLPATLGHDFVASDGSARVVLGWDGVSVDGVFSALAALSAVAVPSPTVGAHPPLTRIESVSLAGVPVTDVASGRIATGLGRHVRGLRVVDVRRTQLTPAGVGILQAMLPGVEILR